MKNAAVGFTVKSGWAASVLVSGPIAAPQLIDSRKIDLSDPKMPETRQPYHAGFGTARKADARLAKLVSSVKRFGGESTSAIVRDYYGAGHKLRGAGIIVGSLIDPAQIANDHIRIHALEGQLFRGVVEESAARAGLPCSVWRERDLYALATQVLRRPESEVRDRLGALGRQIAGPWRAEQKVAALAAWLVLAGR